MEDKEILAKLDAAFDAKANDLKALLEASWLLCWQIKYLWV
jgi:hypothetical protein